MEGLLDAMIVTAPIGLSVIGCVAFGYALEVRESLGKERGLREAAERARDAAVTTLSASKDWEMQEIARFRRLLDCHFDAMIAEATEFRERPVPSPGGVLEGLCRWNVHWKRDLAERSRLRLEDVDRLVKNDLPITPSVARQLETFTGAPARYWEYLWRLYDDYRLEMDETMLVRLGDLSRAREAPKGNPVRESVGTVASPRAAAEPPPSEPPTTLPARRSAVEAPPPAVAHPHVEARGAEAPGGAARAEPRLDALGRPGGLPPPPKPRLRSPVASGASGAETARRAITLTNFPVQGDGPLPASGDGWVETEGSPLNKTLRGVGG